MRANFVLSGVATGIRRNATMTIALILSTAIALAFVGASILANTEITKFKHKYEDKINVSVYLCARLHANDPNCQHKTTATETSAIQDQLRQNPLVKSVAYVSERAAFDRGKQQQATLAQYIKLGDLPASFTVKLKNVKKDYGAFSAQTGALPGVGRVNNQIDTINTLLNIIDSARLLSIVIALVVLGGVDPADRQHHPGGRHPAQERDQHHATRRRITLDDGDAVRARGGDGRGSGRTDRVRAHLVG